MLAPLHAAVNPRAVFVILDSYQVLQVVCKHYVLSEFPNPYLDMN